jgi:predicted aspartyl protease
VAEYNEDYVISGPRGSTRGNAFVDTGATFTVLPSTVADELGIRPYRPETVDTNNGAVQWGVGRAKVSIGGKPAREQDVFIAPAGNPLAIGAESLQISGFKLRANAARARLSICNSCPMLTPHPYLGNVCGACKRPTPIEDRVVDGDCPIARW